MLDTERLEAIEQPLSLLTIDRNQKRPEGRQELLTLRMLEASERKMELIRKLLGRDVEESIRSDLMDRKRDEILHIQRFNQEHLEEMRKEKPASLPVPQAVKQVVEQLGSVQASSRSAFDLKFLTSSELESHLKDKREAVQFFFKANSSDLNSKTDDKLAVELRSGYFAGVYTSDQYKQLKEPQIDLLDRFSSLPVRFGFNLSHQHNADLFKHVSQRNPNYSSNRNLNVFADRLRADGQLDKAKHLVDSCHESPSEPNLKVLHDGASNRPLTSFESTLHAPNIDFTVDDRVLLKEVSFPFIGVLQMNNSKPQQIAYKISFDSVKLSRPTVESEISPKLNLELELINSFEFVLRNDLGDSYKFKLFVTGKNTAQDEFIAVDQLNLDIFASEQICLDTYSRQYKYLPFLSKQFASCEVVISPREEQQIISFSLQEFEIKATLRRIRQTSQSEPNLEKKSYIDKIDEYFFKTGHTLVSSESKLWRIFNKFDILLLYDILTGSNSCGSFFLDPFAVLLHHDGVESLRFSLLAARWIRKLSHQIYLSQYENRKLQTIQQIDSKIALADVLKVGVCKISAISAPEDYKLIEQVRGLADEFLSRLDTELMKRCMYGSIDEQVLSKDLDGKIIEEPRLKFADVRTVAKAVYRLKPKRTVRRPLLPHRKQARQLKQQKNEFDIESQSSTIGGWHHHHLQTGRLQLIVTVQKARNIPLRIDRSQRQMSRPSSPIMSLVMSPTFDLNTSFAPNLTRQWSPLPQTSFLTPPSTYIELVIQRNQLTTSLANGTNPSWNETLFVPLDLNQQQASQGKIQTKASHLFDETLQLNLYDCNSYLQDNANSLSYGQQPTIRVGESQSMSFLESQRIISSSKHCIERCLLGSLRLPLSSLLTSGCIEGTFPLDQPMFLDNYQFEEPSVVTSLEPKFASRPLGQTASLNQFAEPVSKQTMITLFIALDPPMFSQHLNQLEQYHQVLGTTESDDLFQLASLWQDFMTFHWYRQALSKSKLKRASERKTNARRQVSRYVQTLIIDSDLKFKLICRLLRPMEPPESLISSDDRKTVGRIARFVSLLKPLKMGFFSARDMPSRIWFDSNQLLNNMIGGIEEKAVLLCNYLLYLGYCAAIVLGDSIAKSRIVQVIVWTGQSSLPTLEEPIQLSIRSEEVPKSEGSPTTCENFLSRLPILISASNVHFWDVQTGSRHAIGDQNSLVKIGSIVSIENVYANVQQSDAISDTNFDIRSAHLWSALFEWTPRESSLSSLISMTSQLDSSWRIKQKNLDTLRRSIRMPDLSSKKLIEPSIVYNSFTDDQCRQLEQAIEKSIKSNLLKWRSNRPTYFNRTLSRLLADQLISFESQLETLSSEESWKSELARTIREQVLAAYLSSPKRQIVSWPLNTTFTSMAAILDSLFASGVHDVDLSLDLASSTQFLVACHVHPFPARTLSVWLYVGSIMSHESITVNTLQGDNENMSQQYY